jgi:23S rRNA (guanosine2251-2'-O)-methyltransferase
VGHEGQGLRRLVRERCDILLRLPMRGQLESLNAAVAGSILIFQAWQSRPESRG